MADYKTINYPVTPLLKGQTTKNNSLSVAIASDQDPIPITGSITASNASIGPTGGSVPTNATYIGGNSSGNIIGVKVSANGVVSVDCTDQTTGAQKTQITDSSGTAVSIKTLGTQVTSSDQGLIVNAVIHGLSTAGGGSFVDMKVTPSGAVSTAIGDISGIVGQNTMANSLPVTMASNQSTIKTAQTNSKGEFVRNDYTSTSVTTSAYVQLIASTSAAYNAIEIFDSSGQTLKLAIGGSGSEVDQFIIFPGGNGRIPYTVASGSRISIKALSATANTGEIDINFYV